MSLLQTIHLEHLPTTPIHIALYRNVTNASFLQQQLLAGNTDFEYAFIDANVVRYIPHPSFPFNQKNLYLVYIT